ncbi:MAG TPA: polysaccharide biosynthesis protein [Lachnospiraceae bacterium]|nr:polysaccharide biosynthesis protein [Lachnospiraceae bacterium]
MKENNLVKNASVLMIATVISRVIGLIYRRPLGQVLGNVGLGYYGYASNLYAILLLVSSYSIPMAVSKIVSERLALKQYKNAQKVFRGALMYAAIVGGIAALVAFFGGSILLPSNQQNAVPALRVLAPTIFLAAVLGVFRGYFQAHHSMTPTSISQILEQIMNAIVSVAVAYLLIRHLAPEGGTKAAIYGAVGGTTGTAAGVLTGLLVMLFIYMLNRPYFRKEKRKDTHKGEETYGQVFGIIFMMITPIIFTTFVNNAGAYLDSYIYSAMLDRHMSADAISAAYGEYSNYYMPIINIPLALASASASAMMPEVSGEYALHDLNAVNGNVNKTIRLTMFLCIPSMVGMTVLAYPIMGVLFPSSTDLAGKLLLTGAVYVVFAALSTITGSVLQSIGKQRVTLINAAIALVLNIVILAVMLILAPKLSIYAVMLANIFYALIYCIVNDIMLRKYLGYRNEWIKTYLQPLIASAIMGVAAYGIYEGLFMLTRRPFIALLAAVVAAVLLYLIVYVKISGTTKEEMRRFPMGTKLVRILQIIHIYH